MEVQRLAEAKDDGVDRGQTACGLFSHPSDTRSFLSMAQGWWRGYLVMMLQSYLLYRAYRAALKRAE
ncbi:hypothetical protein [Pseudoduganella aquatica]|uniref:Uncharacterized protein n=1 Tax=Pseudoduganella aquatica TaxID=2660641 RepID=A0A7X4HEU4_9BURK|nr:hypothetical protein [Pseudoduganella aquatica]MYN09092.1 hypothetical protein [Pseudoduganella aquatica]